jgi:uncharacterized protein YraI
MKHLGAPLILAAALGMMPLEASAQQFAITAKSVNLRAGPGRAYPIVAVLPPNAQVLVHGCLSGYSWCDVSFDIDRGWVYAGNLSYPYQQGYVPFPGIAPVVGIAIVVFILDDYWGTYYPHQPWYGERPVPPPLIHPAPQAPPPPIGPAPQVRPAPPPQVRPAPPPQVRPAPLPPVRPGPQAHPAPPPPVQPGPQAHPAPGPQGGPGPQAQQGRPAVPPQGQHNASPPRGERPEHPERP